MSLTNGVLCLGSDAGVVTFSPDNMTSWNKYTIALTYWWTRYAVNKTYVEKKTSLSLSREFAVSSGYGYYQVSKTISINQSNGAITLTSPQSLSPSETNMSQFTGAYVYVEAQNEWYTQDDSPYLTVASPGTVLVVKMISCRKTYGNGLTPIYFYSDDAVTVKSRPYYSQGTYIDRVSSSNSSQYPANNYSGSYWYVSDGSSEGPGTFIESVYSTNASAYPDNGAANGYWYVRQ